MSGLNAALVALVLVASTGTGLWAGVAAALDREPGPVFVKAVFAVQSLLVGQLFYVLLRVGGGDRPASTGAFAGYVVLSLLLLPGGLVLSADERTRYGTLVVAVALVAIAVVELRLDATWA